MTAKTTTMTTNNYLYNLPVELQRLIYEYDPTYHEKCKDVGAEIMNKSYLVTERYFMVVSDKPITKRKHKKIVDAFTKHAPKYLPKDKQIIKWNYYYEPWWIEYITNDRIFPVSLHNWPFANVMNLINEFSVLDKGLRMWDKKELVEMIYRNIIEEDGIDGPPEGLELENDGVMLALIAYLDKFN